jgi:hypothetical protein
MTNQTDSDDTDVEILGPLQPRVTSLEELCERFLPTLAARIWETCCWPDRMADGWRIGDSKFIVCSVNPDSRTELYVQLWSEPHEPVLMEVCSGEWSPASVKYVQEPQRRLLRSLGYTKGGQANNFGKDVEVRNVAQAENVAREALRIFFDGFGYRGQWPLQIRCAGAERADEQPVFSSLTPEDLARLLSEHGYRAAIPDVEDTALVLLQRGRRRFVARLDAPVPKQRLYRAVILDAMLHPVREMPDEAVAALNDEIAGLTVRRGQERELRLSMLLLLDGGVTEAWILKSLEYWMTSVRGCERSLQKLQKSSVPQKDRRPGQKSLVH